MSLVAIPVEAYTAHNPSGGQLRLNMLHETCHSRIRYVKTCPIHGEVPDEEIVRGYEYSKGQYAIVDPEEIEGLRAESERALSVDAFFTPAELDPIYYSGQAYYLLPDGPAGRRPYALLHQVMTEENVYGIGQVILSGKDHLFVVRPLDQLLSIDELYYEAEIRHPESLETPLPQEEASKQELKLTKMLVEATAADALDLGRYQEGYSQRLRALVEAKIEGREIARPPEEELPPVINLMDALRESVKQTQTAREGGKTKAEKTPPLTAKKKMAPSRAKRKTAKKKRTG